MKKPNGFILITTLVFILLISLLAYQALESVLLEIKLHHDIENQKFLFDKAQGNLKSSEKDSKSHCSRYDAKNKFNCSKVSGLGDEKFKITSTASRGDMTVILESICVKQADNTCQRLSWRRVM